MEVSKVTRLVNLSQVKNMIALSDWNIFQIIGCNQIIMLSPDDRYYLTIDTDRLNSASNKICLTDREIGRTFESKHRIYNRGFDDLYNYVRLVKYGVKL